MKAFCPRCGKETAGYGPRGLCEDCYLTDTALVEVDDELTVTVCPHCGRVKLGNEWVEVETEQDLVGTILDYHVDTNRVIAVRYEPEADGFDVTIVAERSVDGENLQQEVDLVITVVHDQCGTCAKFFGGYYTYTIQVRGDIEDAAINAMMDRAAEITNKHRDDFIADVQETEHGIDIFVSTRHMAEELIKVLKEDYTVETKRSKELIGVDDGQEVYRSVISARIR